MIVSPVDGYLNDRAPRTGEFVTAGRPVLSVVDTTSFHVDGYFEETKLRHIGLGQKATIELMGETIVLHGHVRSIAAGIEDRDRDQWPQPVARCESRIQLGASRAAHSGQHRAR